MARRAQHVLVVEPDVVGMHQIVTALRRRDYFISSATTAVEATSVLARGPVDLLIVPTHLYSVKGVHFIIGARARSPELAAILIGSEQETALQLDARRHGFAFLVRPFHADELLMVVAERLAAVRRTQRWPRKRLHSHVPVRIASEEGRLTDVSYGGVGFSLSRVRAALPAVIQIEVLESNLQAGGALIWTARSADGVSCVGGIELMQATLPAVAWRQFVDQVY